MTATEINCDCSDCRSSRLINRLRDKLEQVTAQRDDLLEIAKAVVGDSANISRLVGAIERAEAR